MTIDIFSATGSKKGTLTLPESLFGVRVNHGLMHQAVMLQQSNRRNPIAHAKNRNEVAGSTRKLYGQKHTGRARRGSIRSPLLRGGGKAFGPRSVQNFRKDMPRAMRQAALASCLTWQAKKKSILGLEGYPDTVKTKDFAALLAKLPVEQGRRILFVLPELHRGLSLSSRNVPRVKAIQVGYLNPEDVMNARAIVFVGDAIEKAEKIFTKKPNRMKVAAVAEEKKEAPAKSKKSKMATDGKKKTIKKAASKKSSSSAK